MLFNSMMPMKGGRATDGMTEEQITLLRLLKSTGLDSKSINYAYEKLDRLEMVSFSKIFSIRNIFWIQ